MANTENIENIETVETAEAAQSAPESAEVIGVRFKEVGKIYYFDPDNIKFTLGQKVIVETSRGVECGEVAMANRIISDENIVKPLKKVMRPATAEDLKTVEENAERERQAFEVCNQKIAEHNLEMKLVDVEYTFDNNKILFYFTADGRVDFRELVKDLAAVFRTRIELRQIGVRDEAKMLGGIGVCGRPFCCSAFLGEFQPVSIKMAKEQNLSLNPTKISGCCGRLMCCLKNEEETYEYLNSRLPKVGDYVTTGDGLRGEVQSVNVLRQQVKVVLNLENDEKEVREYPVEELKFKPRKRKDKSNNHNKEKASAEEKALKQLEALEKTEGKSKLS